jgi:hypothetical protein
MSVRSTFGNINSPPPNGRIIYENEDKEVNIVKLLANNVAASSDDMVLGNVDGIAEWRLLDGGGEAIVPTLAEVMTQSGVAGTDLNMDNFNITSPGILNIIADGGVGFDDQNNAGSLGQVLVSQGSAPPLWSTVSLSDLPLTGDLEMSGHNILDCAGIANNGTLPLVIQAPGGMGVAGIATFTAPPVCVALPTVANQLANKDYVDTTLAAANGITTDTNNTFTALNSFNAGANITVPGAGYAACSPDPASYNYAGVIMGSLIVKDSVWSFTGDNNEIWELPTPVGNGGASILIINSSAKSTTLYVNGQMRNLTEGQNGSDKTGFHFQQSGCVKLTSFNAPEGGRWGVTFYSQNVSFTWA